MLPDDWLQQLKDAYPKRYGGQGWAALRRLVPARIAEGFTWDEILDGTKAYKKFCEHTGKTGSELVKQAKTFFGRDAWFSEDYDIPEIAVKYRKPEELTPEQRQADIKKWEDDMRKLKVVK